MAESGNRAGGRPRFIDPKILEGLSNLALVARTVAEGTLMGMHRSPAFGFSQEFAEYRAYEPGDDLRHVDWNVFARSDRTYVKRFRGDTNHNVTILFDQSASMAALPATSEHLTKGDYARFAAAAIIYLAARQHDSVGLLQFNDKVQLWRPPSTRANHVARLYHLLDDIGYQGGTNWKLALDYVQAHLARRSLLVVISDFYTDPDAFSGIARGLSARGHDLLLVHVLDAAERTLASEVATVEDAETGEVMVVSADSGGYSRRLTEHCEALARATVDVRGHYLNVFTDQPLDRILADYLRYRAREM
ncbi:MAG: DUF58 domain-containing protein [Proteobacteria bacterium]|nr:DUF58 domain-containing protein [Pseudomonadota bacterium]